MSITTLLLKHEGLKLKPYRCTSGKLTIGVGRNLEDRGITKSEAMYLLSNDIADVIHQLKEKLPVFNVLDQTRQDVLVDMAFNMGVGGLLEFKNTLASIEKGHYRKASKQMLQSKWAKQVPNRAGELSEMMKTGEYQ